MSSLNENTVLSSRLVGTDIQYSRCFNHTMKNGQDTQIKICRIFERFKKHILEYFVPVNWCLGLLVVWERVFQQLTAAVVGFRHPTAAAAGCHPTVAESRFQPYEAPEEKNYLFLILFLVSSHDMNFE